MEVSPESVRPPLARTLHDRRVLVKLIWDALVIGSGLIGLLALPEGIRMLSGKQRSRIRRLSSPRR